MGGKAGSASGQILVQNRPEPRSGSDKIEPAAGGAQKCRPDKKYGRGTVGPMKILQEVSIRIRKFLAKFWSKA